MWRVAGASVKGVSHEINGLPCQDAIAIESIKGGETVICALSDGAGSAKYAEEASKIQTSEALKYFNALLIDHPDPAELIKELDISDGIKLTENIRTILIEAAQQNNSTLSDYSATLLVAIISKKCSVFYQLGDGCWVASRGNIYCAVTTPTQGEYVGQTVFVSSSDYEKQIQFEKIEALVDSVVGFTDGIERLALDIKTITPHYNFFNPLISTFKKEEDRSFFEDKLRTFLSSERVCERTDDDKSIILVLNDTI